MLWIHNYCIYGSSIFGAYPRCSIFVDHKWANVEVTQSQEQVEGRTYRKCISKKVTPWKIRPRSMNYISAVDYIGVSYTASCRLILSTQGQPSSVSAWVIVQIVRFVTNGKNIAHVHNLTVHPMRQTHIVLRYSSFLTLAETRRRIQVGLYPPLNPLYFTSYEDCAS